MPGLGLSIADVATRRSGDAIIPVAITNMVIEGDSQTSTTPDQSGLRDSFYSYAYADDAANASVTFHVRAQTSRTVGGSGDTGSPSGNTLLDHRSEDMGYGPQLITAMFGSNDFGSYSVDATMTKWLNYAPTVRNAGIKLAVVAPPPRHPSEAAYATFNPRWTDYVDRLRNPATRATFADYYIPLGEHPDFRDAATRDATINQTDFIHLTPGATTNTSGQYRAYQVYKAAVDSIRDLTRTNSSSMYSASWPASETNLTPGATITRRIMVKGIAHAGLTSGASISGLSGATIALNGGTPGSSVGTGSGNGRAIYNGDVLDLVIPLSALNSTAVSIDLTIGGETRTVSFMTGAAVTPAAYVHGDVIGQAAASTTHTYASRSFSTAGYALIGVISDKAVPTGVTVGGVSATLLWSQTGNYGEQFASQWLVPTPVSPASLSVVVSFAASRNKSVISYGVLTDINATPTATTSDNAADNVNLSTGSATVPASGIMIGIFGEYGGGTGGAAATISSGNTGTTLIDEDQADYQGEWIGLSIARRVATGEIKWDSGYGPAPRGAAVFKAAGT